MTMKKLLALLLCLMLLPAFPAFCEDAGAMVTIEKKEYDASLSELDLTKVKVTDLSALEAALVQMPNLTYVEFGAQSQSGLDNATMADLRTRWAEKGVKVVWTIKLPRTSYTLKSDATAFSTLHDTNSTRLEDYQVAVLQYATELRALDLGHNWIFNIDFIAPLKELRVLVLSDNRITDISVLEDKPLEYLEMFNNRVKDISCLSGKETLIDLNLCNTHVGDLSVLYTLPNLKRVWMGDIDELTKDTINQYIADKGDTLEAYNFTTKYPTEGGWRTHERYETIKAMFFAGEYISFDTELEDSQKVYLRKDHTY
jgi:hypothetical protein